MRIFTKKLTIHTSDNVQLLNITEKVKQIVKDSNIKDGFVIVYTLHTTTALMINEAEPGLEKDFVNIIKEMFPEEDDYRFHHHFHEKDGRMAVNAFAHFRSVFIGPHLVIPIENGELILGGRQNIYFVELDGPLRRTFVVQVIGV